MSSDEFDSSSTLYECIVFSKICFGYIVLYRNQWTHLQCKCVSVNWSLYELQGA